MNDPLNENNVSPRKVVSIVKALQLNNVESNVANTASNTNATAANTHTANTLLTDIKAQNTQIISLLQQLVDK